jgi:hypothetical protein
VKTELQKEMATVYKRKVEKQYEKSTEIQMTGMKGQILGNRKKK